MYKNSLTDIEMEFLRLATTDMIYKKIADEMKLPLRKIDHIRDNLFEKLDVKSRVGLAMYAVKCGLVLV